MGEYRRRLAFGRLALGPLTVAASPVRLYCLPLVNRWLLQQLLHGLQLDGLEVDGRQWHPSKIALAGVSTHQTVNFQVALVPPFDHGWGNEALHQVDDVCSVLPLLKQQVGRGPQDSVQLR